MAQPMPAELTPRSIKSVSLAERCGKLIVSIGLDAGRQFHGEARMADRCAQAVDDRGIEMGADKAHLVAARACRQAHG